MHRIIRIEGVEEKKTAQNNTYYKTYAVLENGEECVGYGKEFDLNDKVMTFYEPKWDVIKMIKYKVDK